MKLGLFGLFCNSPPGRIIPIGGKEHAFVPNPLPPDWQPNEQLCPDIAEAVRVIGVLDGIGRFLPNPAILLRPTEDREAIQSSALEGTYATPKELLLFEMSPLEPAADTDASNRFRPSILRIAKRDRIQLRYGFVAHTTDGGLTWQTENVPGVTDVEFEDLLFTDAHNGWVGGNIGIWHRSRLPAKRR